MGGRYQEAQEISGLDTYSCGLFVMDLSHHIIMAMFPKILPFWSNETALNDTQDELSRA